MFRSFYFLSRSLGAKSIGDAQEPAPKIRNDTTAETVARMYDPNDIKFSALADSVILNRVHTKGYATILACYRKQANITDFTQAHRIKAGLFGVECKSAWKRVFR